MPVASIWARPTTYSLYQYYITIHVKDGGWTTKVIASSRVNAILAAAKKCKEKGIDVHSIKITKDPAPVNRSNRDKEIRLKYYHLLQDLSIDKDF